MSDPFNLMQIMNNVYDRIKALENKLSSLDSRIAPGISNPGEGITGTPLVNLLASPIEKHRFLIGVVSLSLPYCNVYKVDLENNQGSMMCMLLQRGSTMPFGVTAIDSLVPGERVLVYCHHGMVTGVVVGSIPTEVMDVDFDWTDSIHQSAATGFKKDDIYQQIANAMQESAELRAFKNNYPEDHNISDKAFLSTSGVGILISEFMTFIRANEMASLMFSYLDSYGRLAAKNFDFWSTAEDWHIRDDENEISQTIGQFLYPWESIGAYKQDATIHQEISAERAQYTDAAAANEPIQPDMEPFARIRKYGGYLGQGGREVVVAPPVTAGDIRTTTESDFDVGLMQVAKTTDGSYLVQAADSITLIKRNTVVEPRRRRAEENPDGDNATNYRASGLDGNGSPHRVNNPVMSDSDPTTLRTASLMDSILHLTNWKATHPFRYHAQDFQTPNESELPLKSNTRFNFDELKNRRTLPEPQKQSIKVDHRQTVEYLLNYGLIRVDRDGSIVLGNGSGVSITLSADGNLYLSCPGDINVLPGRSLNAWAGDDVNMRAKNSTDIVTGKDLRLKAENNLQTLSGNSGTGSTLIECKGSGDFDFKDKYGEDVKGGGIVLRSIKSGVITMSQDLYLRVGTKSGKDTPGNGRIWLDAAQGRSDLVINARQVHTYTSSMSTWFGNATDKSFKPQGAMFVNATTAVFSQQASFQKSLAVAGGLAVMGGIQVQGTGVVVYDGHFASTTGGMVGQVKKDNKLQDTFQDLKTAHNQVKDGGQETYKNEMVDLMYADNKPGSIQTQSTVMFSYRDEGTGEQYGTAGTWEFPEQPWQRMTNTGESSGGAGWTEKPVICGERTQYPYPGKQKLEDQPVYQRYNGYRLYVSADGVAVDQPEGNGGAFENPVIGPLVREKLNGSYKVISGN